VQYYQHTTHIRLEEVRTSEVSVRVGCRGHGKSWTSCKVGLGANAKIRASSVARSVRTCRTALLPPQDLSRAPHYKTSILYISLHINTLYSTMSASTTIKGIDKPAAPLDGSSLRVAIVHARWNKVVIDALVAGAVAKLEAAGVKKNNIIIESVPGSFELPLATQK
jgi:hypothetical protein